MKAYEIKLIAKLLELASEELGHSCNEYDLVKEGFTPEEAYQLNLAYAKWRDSGDFTEEDLQSHQAVAGFDGLMAYFADRVKRLAESTPPEPFRRSAPERPPATPEHLRTDTTTRWG